MEATLYNQKGTEAGKVTLPESIFGLPWNADLVHQVVTSMASSARHSIAHTKNRGEVRGGGKKPWQQKGTGRARHGSSRSPLWVGGGMTHGPRSDKNYDRKVNRKMKGKALFTILSRKYRDGEVTFVNTLSIESGKTKDALSTVNNLIQVNTKNSKKDAILKLKGTYISIPTRGAETMRSFQNISGVSLEETRTMNPLSLMNHRRVILVNPEESFALLQGKLADERSEAKAPKERKSKVEKKVKPAKVAKKTTSKPKK